MSRQPRVRRADLKKIRQRYRVDQALMTGSDEHLVIAAKDYWHAQVKRLRPAERLTAAAALIQAAENLTEEGPHEPPR